MKIAIEIVNALMCGETVHGSGYQVYCEGSKALSQLFIGHNIVGAFYHENGCPAPDGIGAKKGAFISIGLKDRNTNRILNAVKKEILKRQNNA